jgi:hypothetical protein
VTTEIQNYIAGKKALITGISSRLYYSEAPSSPTRPYVVFAEITDMDTFDSGQEFQDIKVQFDAYAQTLNAVQTIQTDLKTIFNGVSVSTTNYRSIKVKRNFHFNKKEEEETWHGVAEFTFYVSKN